MNNQTLLYVYTQCRKRAEKSESREVKAKVNMLSEKYTCMRESKAVGMVMSVVDIVTEQEHTRDTSK